jgi:hypothetical protein
MDILVFVVLAAVFEYINYFASTNLQGFKLMFLSYSVVLSLICIFRWGYVGSIVAMVGGLAACLTSSTLKSEIYLSYGLGNLIGMFIPSLFFLNVITREKMKNNKLFLVLYLMACYVSVVVFRCLILSLFDKDIINYFVNSLRGEFIMESVSFVISIVILLIAARSKGDLVVEMKAYIKEVQERQKLGGLKEIKESPNFNAERQLTKKNEMDEAYILDGGTLSEKELRELDKMMQEELDLIDENSSLDKNN